MAPEFQRDKVGLGVIIDVNAFDIPVGKGTRRGLHFVGHSCRTSLASVAADVAEKTAESNARRSLSFIDEVESSAILPRFQDFGYLL